LTAPIEEVIEPQLGEPDDKDLVLAFKRGDEGSYQAIHERYSARVKGICRRMLDQPHDAEEASQETFMRVYTALPNFNGRYQLGAWMSRIATNVCLDHLRSRTRHPSDAVDHDTLCELPGAAVDEGPEELLIADAERKRVRAVLAELAPMHRAAIALREFEGMTYNEIAIALGMTEPQVKALIHRARKAFKKQWAPGLAALIPWRLLSRVRKFSTHYDTPPQVTDAAVSSMHFATSCSAALQQCGAFMTDKVATAMTAVIVGAAAVTGVVAPTKPAATPAIKHGAEATIALQRESKVDPVAKKKPKEKVVAVAEADPQDESQSAPAASPTPTASPTTSPEPGPTPNSGTTDGSEDKEASPEKPTAPSLAFSRGTVVPSGKPISNTVTVDCAATRVEQRLQSQISYDGQLYPALFTFASGQMTLTVTKDDHEVGYNGGGEIITKTTAKGYMNLVYAGSYGWDGRGHPGSANLPYSGTFRAELRLDCARVSVITESLAFGVN